MTYEYDTVSEAIERGIKPALQPYTREFDPTTTIADIKVTPTPGGTYLVSDGEGSGAAAR